MIFAKKSLGQNFLKDINIIEKIVTAGDIQESDVVLEIGPGHGTLTAAILKNAKKVIAVEKDVQLCAELESTFSQEIESGKLELVCDDILDAVENGELEIGSSYKLMGNIPYNITGAIFWSFTQGLSESDLPTDITFVVQKEVAERIVAKDGKESILSISIKAYGEPKIYGIIKAGSFDPTPKVDSAILKIQGLSKERFENNHVAESDFFELIHKGFAHKRKQLLGNLKGHTSKFFASLEQEHLKTKLEQLGHKQSVRAEELAVSDWFYLVRNQTR